MASEPRAAGWQRDPTGQHAQRYWDGTAWKDHVAGAAGGPPALDTLGADDALDPLASTGAGTAASASVAAPPHGVDGAAAEQESPLAARGAAEPSWYRDPSGRHPQRYWDGNAWTAFVAPAAGGPPRHDPFPADDATTVTSTPPGGRGGVGVPADAAAGG